MLLVEPRALLPKTKTSRSVAISNTKETQRSRAREQTLRLSRSAKKLMWPPAGASPWCAARGAASGRYSSAASTSAPSSSSSSAAAAAAGPASGGDASSGDARRARAVARSIARRRSWSCTSRHQHTPSAPPPPLWRCGHRLCCARRHDDRPQHRHPHHTGPQQPCRGSQSRPTPNRGILALLLLRRVALRRRLVAPDALAVLEVPDIPAAPPRVGMRRPAPPQTSSSAG